MDTTGLIALAPLLVMTGTLLAAMLGVAFYRNHVLTASLTFVGLSAALGSLSISAQHAPRQVTALLRVDSFGIFFTGLVCLAALAVVVFSYGYFSRIECRREELYLLLLISTIGSAALTMSNHFVSAFLGLEILSVGLYALVAYLRSSHLTLEAGIKYLILASASAAFLLFGMALIYAALGTLEFGRMAAMLSGGETVDYSLVLPGVALLIAGIGFKLALVPFHMWTPDVYEGAPAPVTAFVATVSKGAMFALLLRYFHETALNSGAVFVVFSAIAVASMFAGNLLALLQENVKRILAYSSIAHLGYLLVGFQAGGQEGARAATFYLVTYVVTILGAFGIVALLSKSSRDADRLEDYRGLFWKQPLFAGIFTVMLLSLAGIPLTGGFLGKFYVVAAGVSARQWVLVFVLVVASAIGLFYYLRILVTMYSRPAETVSAAPAGGPAGSTAGSVLLAGLTLLLIWLGVYPSALLRVIDAMTAAFGS